MSRTEFRGFPYVTPASPERWEDIQALFAHTACWCQYWRLPAAEYGRARKEDLPLRIDERREALRRQLDQPDPPGILAYINGQVCGWCGIGPRSDMQRLVRSRSIPLVDDRPVWSIVCFLVRPGFRRRGVARALLQGAVDCAKMHRVPALEAYPVETKGKRIDSTYAYVGALSMFELAGFKKVMKTAAQSAGLPRWLVRLEL
jgi:GNAT superfamily N-acetyltransferase